MPIAIDFAPYRRSTVGFESLFDMLENSAANQIQENYPPFDLVALDDNRFRIDLAVAGLKQDEIDITAQQNVLVVSGKRKDDDRANFIHKGIATRSFERRFALADHIKVRGADLNDGLLSVELAREIPEALKARKINIGNGSQERSDRGTIGDNKDQPAFRQTIDANAQMS